MTTITANYILQPESAMRLRDTIAQVMAPLRFFIPRGEQTFEFKSESIFYSADIKITSAAFAPREPGDKTLDVVLGFDFTDVQAVPGLITDTQTVRAFLRTGPKLLEVKTVFPPSPVHNSLAVQPYGPNYIIIGQVDHFGDPEMLFTKTLASAFNGLELRVLNTENL